MTILLHTPYHEGTRGLKIPKIYLRGFYDPLLTRMSEKVCFQVICRLEMFLTQLTG